MKSWKTAVLAAAVAGLPVLAVQPLEAETPAPVAAVRAEAPAPSSGPAAQPRAGSARRARHHRRIPRPAPGAAAPHHSSPRSAPAATRRQAARDPRHVVVRFRPGTPAAARAAVRRAAGATSSKRLGPGPAEVLTLRRGDERAALARLRRDGRVAVADTGRRYTTLVRPDDPLFSSQWSLDNTGQSGGLTDADIDGPEAFGRLGLQSSPAPWAAQNFAVGVVDTGIDTSHEDLTGRAIQPCSSALTGSGAFTPGCLDDDGHGTHVAGTVAAIGNNAKGIAGVAPGARVYPCKALDAAGDGWDIDIAACIYKLVDQRNSYNMRVISMSLGSTDASLTLEDAVNYAFDRGVLVVAAAGNDGNGNLDYPAGFANAVSVGATDRHDARASFSNANSDVEVSAPGVGIVSTVPTYPTADLWDPSGYASASGTSMATPHAAAVAALIAWRTGKTGAALRDALDHSVNDLGPPGRDDAFGYGRVNACLALGGGCSYRGVAPPASATGIATPPGGSSQGTTRTYRPSGVRVLSGRARGSVRRLYANDSSRLEVSSRRQGSANVADVYTSASVPRALRTTGRAFGVAYEGNVSRPAGVRLLVYDWSAHRWTTINLARRAPSRDRGVRWSTARVPARFISTSGAVRLRIRATGRRPLRTRTDVVRFSVTV